MKLVVLAGAKKDAAVPLKKDRFVIGRSKECSLRAGSDAISRQHCELTRTPEGVSVRDLGSRNGTYVNDTQIEAPRLLENGDRLRIGPLEFRFETEAQLDQAKQPKVNGVGEAVARAASKAEREISEPGMEESISGWLLDAPDGAGPQALTETQTFNVDETRAITKQLTDSQPEADNSTTDETAAENADAEAEEETSKKKKQPGKLPKDAFKPKSKDSKEAAEQILRDMARRR